MGRLSASLLLLALGAVAAVGLSACGGGKADLLPGSTASEIEANLDQVRELAGEGECIGAENAVQAVGTQVRQLGGVDKQLKQALREGVDRLGEVVESCEEPEEAEETEAIAPAEEAEATEKPHKPEKSKPPKEAEAEAPAETAPEATPAPPGNGAGSGQGEAPPVEPGGGAPSGGVGPGAPVEGGD